MRGEKWSFLTEEEVNDLEVLDSIWFGLKIPVIMCWQIGIVAVRVKISKEIKLYIGLGHGDNQQLDEKMVIERGVPFYALPVMGWLIRFVNIEKAKKE